MSKVDKASTAKKSQAVRTRPSYGAMVQSQPVTKKAKERREGKSQEGIHHFQTVTQADDLHAEGMACVCSFLSHLEGHSHSPEQIALFREKKKGEDASQPVNYQGEVVDAACRFDTGKIAAAALAAVTRMPELASLIGLVYYCDYDSQDNRKRLELGKARLVTDLLLGSILTDVEAGFNQIVTDLADDGRIQFVTEEELETQVGK